MGPGVFFLIKIFNGRSDAALKRHQFGFYQKQIKKRKVTEVLYSKSEKSIFRIPFPTMNFRKNKNYFEKRPKNDIFPKVYCTFLKQYKNGLYCLKSHLMSNFAESEIRWPSRPMGRQSGKIAHRICRKSDKN